MRQICSWRLGPCTTCPLSKCSQRCQETWGFPRGLFTEVVLLEKETAWGKAVAAEGRYPADVAFVCRCSKWSSRWQLITVFTKCEYELTASHTLPCVPSSVRCSRSSASRIFLSWKRRLYDFLAMRSNPSHPWPLFQNRCHNSELKMKLQNTQVPWSPVPGMTWVFRQVNFGAHHLQKWPGTESTAVWVYTLFISYATSPNLAQSSKCLLCPCANISVIYCLLW